MVNDPNTNKGLQSRNRPKSQGNLHPLSGVVQFRVSEAVEATED